MILQHYIDTGAGIDSATAVLACTKLEHLHQGEQNRLRDRSPAPVQRETVGEVNYQGRNIACVQVWTVLFRLMEEVTDARGAFQREGGIQRAPGKRSGTGTVIFGLFTTSSVAGAGKFSFKGACVYPVFGMGPEYDTGRCFQETPGYIFIGQHFVITPRCPSYKQNRKNLLDRWLSSYGVHLYYSRKGRRVNKALS